MTARSCVVLLLGVFMASPAIGQSPAPAARVKLAAGSAFVVHEGRGIPAAVGTAVFEQDSLATGADGRVGITLRDDTRLSIGPQTTIDFFFQAEDGIRGLYVTGVQTCALPI